MGERGVRVRPAWRASASDEEARAFLQRRLATYSGVLFAALVAIQILVACVYESYDYLLPPSKRVALYIGMCVTFSALGLSWRVVLARRTLSERALYRIDLTYAIVLGLAFAAAGIGSHERRAAGYAVLIQCLLMVFTRAFLVPSTGRRTAVVSSAALAPLVFASIVLAAIGNVDMPGPAFSIAAFVLCGVAILLATLGSRLIYDLRRRVSQARQLGQYTLESKIGEGGMGTVYRGHHVLLRRPTAIKLIRADRVGADALERFEREVQHTSQLAHPNTVSVFDYGRTRDGVFYYAMELLDGMDLELIVHRHGAIPQRRAIDVLLQVCGALQEAHERGIIHRDIKPANIILCQHGGACDVAKVVDFGLVKDLKNDVSNDGVVGTPSYTAPETVTDPKAVTSSVDLYALGAVGYYLLSGRRVFEGTSALDLCVQHVTKEPKPLSQVAPEVVPELEQIIMRCLRKPPHERFETVAALAEALRAVRVNDWSEEDAASWWSRKRHEAALSNPSLPTQTLTIDMTRRL